jgi:ADP-heptose:LPS heptosyltransferase
VDKCDTCFELENIENQCLENKLKLDKHLSEVKEYRDFKKSLIENIDNVCIEFDYCANKAFPKLNNNSSYFKRSLYLYLINFHVHKSNFNFIFHTLEGMHKKVSDSICSYLKYVIEFLQLNSNLDNKKMIVLLSDSADGQNKNWTVIKFTIFMSILLEMKIIHVFPVRGHSYNICDIIFILY